MLRNKYTDTSVQKGEIPGFSSYVEHTSALTQLLHEARINHKDLTVVWLDQAHAYGSIPHQLIQLALHQYYIPDHSSNLIMNYFNNNHLRFSRSRFTTTSFKNILPQGFIASSLSNCLSWFKHDYQGSKKGHQGKH